MYHTQLYSRSRTTAQTTSEADIPKQWRAIFRKVGIQDDAVKSADEARVLIQKIQAQIKAKAQKEALVSVARSASQRKSATEDHEQAKRDVAAEGRFPPAPSVTAAPAATLHSPSPSRPPTYEASDGTPLPPAFRRGTPPLPAEPARGPPRLQPNAAPLLTKKRQSTSSERKVQSSQSPMLPAKPASFPQMPTSDDEVETKSAYVGEQEEDDDDGCRN